MLPCDKLSNFVYKDKIYIFGGYGPQPSPDLRLSLPHTTTWIMDPQPGQTRGWNNQLVIYDPSKNEYTWPITHGKPPSPRAAHATTVDPELGTVYLFGGTLNYFYSYQFAPAKCVL